MIIPEYVIQTMQQVKPYYNLWKPLQSHFIDTIEFSAMICEMQDINPEAVDWLTRKDKTIDLHHYYRAVDEVLQREMRNEK